jgi:hypothetical protein
MGNGDCSPRLMGSAGSILSIGSSGSILSIGSAGSILSVGSAGSILSIGSAGSLASVLSVGSYASFGSVLSGLSRWSILAWRSRQPRPKSGSGRRSQTKDLTTGAVQAIEIWSAWPLLGGRSGDKVSQPVPAVNVALIVALRGARGTPRPTGVAVRRPP